MCPFAYSTQYTAQGVTPHTMYSTGSRALHSTLKIGTRKQDRTDPQRDIVTTAETLWQPFFAVFGPVEPFHQGNFTE